MTRQHIKVLYWNIHGIYSRAIGEKNQDKELIRIVEEFDIICISELHTDKTISIPGFVLKKQKFRPKVNKSPKISGGIAVYAKQNIENNFHLIPNNNVDSIWIRTNPSESKAVRLGFYYCSPEKKSSNFFDTIQREIERFGDDYNTYIFGDMNARTKTEQEIIIHDKSDDEFGISTTIHIPPPPRNSEDMKLLNKRGKDLLDICKINDLVIANGRTMGDLFGKYTCHQTSGSSVVDYLISTYKSRENIIDFSVGSFLPTLSDHCSIQATISTGMILHEEEYAEVELLDLPPKYIWSREHDLPFKDKLESEPFKQKVSQIMSSGNRPNLVHDIRNLLTEAADQCKIKKTRKKRGKQDAPWFDEECKGLKNSISTNGKKLRRNPGDVSIREKLYEEKRQLSKLVKKKKFLYKKSIVDEMCQNLSSGEKKEYWKMLRKLDGPPDTTKYMHEQQLISHFKSILNDPNADRIINSNKEYSRYDTSDLNGKIDKDELSLARKVLKNGKSPGLDTVLNEMIDPLAELYPELLLKLFNSILSNTWISEDWLMSLITAIHKKGAKEDPDNYRGISLMSCMAKLFLTIINNRLTTFALEHKILSPGQLGFVSGNRTSDPHIILNNIVQKYCHRKKKKLFGCFVDFSKAFDSVPRDLLLDKLSKNGINGKVFEIIKTIYTEDKASVKFGDKFSPTFRTNRGVRQGCVLSPLLFNIFLSDIQNIFDKCGHNPKLNDTEISCLLWADDILILSDTEEGLQAKLDNLARYCKKNKLEVNTDKTKAMIFTKSGRLLKHQFYFRKTALENVRSYKYLGFLVTPSGEIKSGLEDLRVRALRAIAKIRKSLGPLFQNNIWNTLHLYNYMVKPILLYCCDFWGTLKHPKNSPIERIHRSFLKQLLGVRQTTTTHGVHLELGTVPIIFNAIKGAVKNWERIRQYNCNDLLMDAFEESTETNLPWATSIKQTFESNGMLETFLAAGTETQESETPHILLFQRLKDQFHQDALASINEEGSKLKMYGSVKTETGTEKYLTDITNVKHRVDLTRLRLSSHSLNIETGRHTKPKTDRVDRICTLCNTNTVEDETHVLVNCPCYSDIRTEHIHETILTANMTDYDKAVKILKSEDLKPIAKFTHEIFKTRDIMLDSLASLQDMIEKN